MLCNEMDDSIIEITVLRLALQQADYVFRDVQAKADLFLVRDGNLSAAVFFDLISR